MSPLLFTIILTCQTIAGPVECHQPRDDLDKAECEELQEAWSNMPLDWRGPNWTKQHLMIMHYGNESAVDCGLPGDPT